MDVVYINTRGRPRNIRKLLPIWHNINFDVVLVVEPDEIDMYNEVAMEFDFHTDIVRLPKCDQGLAYSRNFALTHAFSFGRDSIIVTDDDIKPAGGMDNLVADAGHEKVLGITARYSYHDFALGHNIHKLGGVILQPCGMFRMVALNVKNVINLGNYDPEADNCEDADLMLRGIKAGFPWMVDLDTKALSMGKRHEPGGSLDYITAIGRSVAEHTNSKPTLEDKFPDIVSNTNNKTRVSWRKAHDKYLPEWRKWSALHGGDIYNYLEPTS